MKTPQTLIEAVRYFTDLNVCREYLASARWPQGITCPRNGCGSRQVWFIATRAIWRCKSCRRQFSVKVGSIFEDSPLGLDKWLPAIWLLTCSKKGYSSHRLAAALGVTQKTAWFMLHRIRLAMRAGSFNSPTPMSGPIESDTTGIGGKEKFKHADKRLHRGTGNVGKAAVFGLLSRHGEVRAKRVLNEQADTLHREIRRNVDLGSTIYTDQAAGYRGLNREYVHEVINHSESYVRGQVHTNGIENFWSLFKRTVYGTHHFVMPWQLDRYLDDATFRFNHRQISDAARFQLALAETDGRRLTYRQLTGKDGQERLA